MYTERIRSVWPCASRPRYDADIGACSHSSRSSVTGSSDSARCAGIHVASSPQQRPALVAKLPGSGLRGPVTALQRVARLSLRFTRRCACRTSTRLWKPKRKWRRSGGRHDYLAEWVFTAQDNVASHLPDYVEARTLQGSHTLPSGYNGEVAHTVTRRASKCSSGTGKLSTSRAPT